MWINFNISDEVIGFARNKIRMVTKIEPFKESYPHFHGH